MCFTYAVLFNIAKLHRFTDKKPWHSENSKKLSKFIALIRVGNNQMQISKPKKKKNHVLSLFNDQFLLIYLLTCLLSMCLCNNTGSMETRLCFHEPISRNSWASVPQRLKARRPTGHAPQLEEPLWWEAAHN